MPVVQCENPSCRMRKVWNDMWEVDRRYCCPRCAKDGEQAKGEGSPAKQLLLFQMSREAWRPHTRE
jgi:hypothetical protein